MNFLPAYILLSLIVLLAFIRPKSLVIHFALLSVIFIFFAFSYDNADRLVYQYEFETINSSSASAYEILYVALMKFGSFFCDTFQQYRCFQALLVLTLLDVIVLKNSKAPNVVLASYLIFSALFDATLMRHAVAMSVSLYGLFLLIRAQGSRDIVAAFFIFIACGLLHSSYWVLLAFIPLSILLKKYPIITMLFAFIGYFVAIKYQNALFSIFGLLVIREGVIDKYMTGEYANLTGAVYDLVKYFIIISPCFLWAFIKKKYETTEVAVSNNTIKNSRIFLLNKNIVLINLLFSIILIPQFFAVLYNRLFRVLLVINYIFLANLYTMNNRRNHFVALFMIFYSLSLLLLLFWESEDTLQEVWFMHFETNSVFKLLNY